MRDHKILQNKKCFKNYPKRMGYTMEDNRISLILPSSNWLLQIVRANLFSTTDTTDWSSFVVVTNLTSFAFATNFFEPAMFTFSVFFAHFSLSKHFEQRFINCVIHLLNLKHSNNKKCLHFVHFFLHFHKPSGP